LLGGADLGITVSLDCRPNAYFLFAMPHDRPAKSALASYRDGVSFTNIADINHKLFINKFLPRIEQLQGDFKQPKQ